MIFFLNRVDKEFNGFQRLFAKYLAADVDTSVHWDKIEKLPANSVSSPTPAWPAAGAQW
jgi:hypothetical protein